jgi:hypothetical protein
MLLMKPPLQSNNACGVDVFVVVALLWTVRLTLTTPFTIILLTIAIINQSYLASRSQMRKLRDDLSLKRGISTLSICSVAAALLFTRESEDVSIFST